MYPSKETRCWPFLLRRIIAISAQSARCPRLLNQANAQSPFYLICKLQSSHQNQVTRRNTCLHGSVQYSAITQLLPLEPCQQKFLQIRGKVFRTSAARHPVSQYLSGNTFGTALAWNILSKDRMILSPCHSSSEYQYPAKGRCSRPKYARHCGVFGCPSGRMR